MNTNISIPSGDFAVLTYRLHGEKYLALLKMNYKESYVHMTNAEEKGNVNQIICYQSTLPALGAKLSEAVIIKLSDFSVRIVEKKYEINGTKKNYLSEIFLKCKAAMSQKSRLSIVTKAVEQINKKHYEEEPEKQMEAKRIIKKEIEDTGSLNVERVSEKLYQDEPQIKEEFDTKMEKYHMEKAEVTPKSERTMKKFEISFTADPDFGFEYWNHEYTNVLIREFNNGQASPGVEVTKRECEESVKSSLASYVPILGQINVTMELRALDRGSLSRPRGTMSKYEVVVCVEGRLDYGLGMEQDYLKVVRFLMEPMAKKMII